MKQNQPAIANETGMQVPLASGQVASVRVTVSVSPYRPNVVVSDRLTAAGEIPRPLGVKRKHGKATAIDVAKYLVYLAACEEEPDFLSHLRLQKLLYYVQGWSLVLRNKVMFDDNVEAWAHGPVVRSVYFALSHFGDRSILPDSIGLPDKLTDEELDFIQRVWQSYKKFSASSLREMTHQETPWVDARKGLSPADKSDRVIAQSAMKKFFDSLAT